MRRRFSRFGLRTLLIVVTLFCILFGWLGWRVNRMRRQQAAINSLKARGTFLFHMRYDWFGASMGRWTGDWSPYGDVSEVFLCHDVYKPLNVQFEPQDIDLLKEFPYLTAVDFHCTQRQETIVRLAQVDSLESVNLHMNAVNDPGVLMLQKLRPDVKVVAQGVNTPIPVPNSFQPTN